MLSSPGVGNRMYSVWGYAFHGYGLIVPLSDSFTGVRLRSPAPYDSRRVLLGPGRVKVYSLIFFCFERLVVLFFTSMPGCHMIYLCMHSLVH